MVAEPRRKLWRVVSLDLYTGAFAIGFAGERSKRGCQPVDRRAAQEIILRTQIEIPRNVCAAGPRARWVASANAISQASSSSPHFKKVKSKKVKGKKEMPATVTVV